MAVRENNESFFSLEKFSRDLERTFSVCFCAPGMPPSNTPGVFAHDHDCEDAEHDCSSSYVIYKTINLSKTTCLNEEVANSCRNVFRPWGARTERIESPLRSVRADRDDDDDEGGNELLLHVEFDASVKLRAFSVVGGLGDEFESRPRSVRLYINRDDLDFGTVRDLQPVQAFDLLDNQAGEVEYPVRAAKFNGVHSIDMHFPAISESDHQAIYFIGFKGEYASRRREAVDAVYEGVPLPGDHKVPGDERRNLSYL